VLGLRFPPTGQAETMDVSATRVRAIAVLALLVAVVAAATGSYLIATEPHASRTGQPGPIGMGGAGYTTLFDRTLTKDTTTIDTGPNGIAQGYDVLTIWIVAKTDDLVGGDGTDGGTLIPIYATVNGDTRPDYDFTYIVQGGYGTFGHGVLRAQDAWELTAHGSGGTGNYPAVDRITIPGYAATAFGKVGVVTTASPDGMADDDTEAVFKSLGWRSNGAIDRLTITTGGTNKLKTGSRLLIFGSR
jgi:hypothetical protein